MVSLGRAPILFFATMNSESLWLNWGRWLQRERKAAGLSQNDLAEKAGITRTHISDLERGISGAKRDTVILLSNAIGADVNEGLRLAGFAPSESNEAPTLTEIDRHGNAIGETVFTAEDRERLDRIEKMLNELLNQKKPHAPDQ